MAVRLDKVVQFGFVVDVVMPILRLKLVCDYVCV